MRSNLKIGDIIGIYEVLNTDAPRSKDNHKQIHVKCTQCGLEKDIRPQHLGATICNHKQKLIPKSCKCCSAIIPYDENTDAIKYKAKVFCNSSCAATFNNKRSHSEESKIKASKTALIKHYGENLELYEAKLQIKNEHRSRLRSSRNASKYYYDSAVDGQDYVVCPYCNLRFSQIQIKHLRLHNKTFDDLYIEFGNDYKVISDTTYVKKVKAGKESQQKLIDAGEHQGWRSRNKVSYAEQYWTKVLDNCAISYEREFPIWHGSANYFLDFKLERNGKLVDLEIDGKQHNYEDRAALDIKRDAFMESAGYFVYRIPWNGVNSPEGRQLMQEKIHNFLDFYNSL
jgi:very-short-patch-repair endonuclease